MRDKARAGARTRRAHGPPQAADRPSTGRARATGPRAQDQACDDDDALDQACDDKGAQDQTVDDDDALDHTIDEQGLPALRSAVAAYAGRVVSDERVDELVLLAHELASNVVRHGGGEGRLRLWAEGGQLLCRVSDSGPGMADAEATGAGLPAPKTPGGRGLWIARRLATVRIDTGPAGTTVTAAMPVDRSEPG
jgi:anti-sigma regulatory factor (Ser/Thr protein kinase)